MTAAAASRPGPRAELLVGARIESVESLGKHLLIRFDKGLELRTHLGMRGSWHRYPPGERWLRSPSRARLILEVPGAVAVCFDAPTVELYEIRAEPAHPVLSALVPNTTDSESARRRVTDRLCVYRRAGRPCRRCGAVILTRTHGRINRLTYWCPKCQPAAVEEPR